MVTVTMVHRFSLRQLAQFITLLTLLLMVSTALFADLTATVDRNRISEGEAFQYILRDDGFSLTGSPNLSPLEQDFNILGTSQSNQIRMINGRNESWIEWTITLMPKRVGTLQIPAITYKGEVSNPIAIEVSKSSSSARQGATADSPVFMRSSISANKIWQGQEAVLTLKIFTRANFADNPDLTPPESEGAIFKLLSNDKREEHIVQGVRYQVITVEYLVTPTRPGILTIPGQVLTGATVEEDPYGGRSLLRMTRSRPFRISSPDMDLTISPPPASWPADKPWLPAQDVSLSESWSSSLSKLKTGDSITRTVTINTKGTNSAQIPPLPPLNLDGVNSYPDQPRIDDTIDNRGALGTRSESVALVPTVAGKITIPAISISWFNVKTETVETSRLEAQTIVVQPGTSPQIVMQAPTSQLAPQGQQPTEALQTSASRAAQPVNLLYWQLATGLFALFWLGTLAVLLRKRNHSEHSAPITKQSTGSRNKVEADLFNSLLTACTENNLSQVEQTLLLWGNQITGQQLSSSGEMVRTLQHEGLLQQWQELQRNCYGRSSQSINTAVLTSLIKEVREQWLVKGKSSAGRNHLSINP